MKKALLIAVGALFMVMFATAVIRAADDKPVIKPYKLDTCAVCGMKLGEMGKPVTFTYKDREIKVCDASEQKDFLKEPDKYVKQIEAAEAKLKK
jgi:nitrous oxide reductase accessory protein NosL